MKQLELNLNKKLLIVEAESAISAAFFVAQYEAEVNGRHLELLCKGPDLTEEIADKLVEKKLAFTTPEIYFYKDYKYDLNSIPSAIVSFKSAIENAGYYWGTNPVEKPEMSPKSNEEIWDDQYQFEEWQEAESRTFNIDNVIIFEIL